MTIHVRFLLLLPLLLSLHPANERPRVSSPPGLQQENEYEERRLRMVQEQMAERDITDPAALQAMRRVQRHRFVPDDLIDEAYSDRPLPIGYGQTISQPYIVALMTQLLAVKKSDHVLEIGTGSGYQAAVLAEIVDSVWTVEIVQELAKSAEERLWRLGYGKVHVKWADGYNGWPDHAPFDAIVVTAAAEHIPPPLVQQLKEGGRMVIPVGHPFFVQNLVLVEKRAGKVTTHSIAPVRFVPLTRQK